MTCSLFTKWRQSKKIVHAKEGEMMQIELNSIVISTNYVLIVMKSVEKCSECFNFVQRDTINKQFWGLSFRERRLWLDSYIAVEDVKRRKISNNIYERKHSLKYFLPLGLEKSHVCKSMFLSTLGLKTDGMITGFISAKTNADEGIQSMLKDYRGHSTPTKKKNAKIIKEHISSYQPKVSHYASENAPNRLF